MSSTLPYTCYTSADGVDIFVGKNARANDELSFNPEYSSCNDWWLHLSDIPGTHVVVKCEDDDLPGNFRETLLDAATLAVLKSSAAKDKPANGTKVSVCRVGQVTKPKRAKAGMVALTGDILTISISAKEQVSRLKRLLDTQE